MPPPQSAPPRRSTLPPTRKTLPPARSTVPPTRTTVAPKSSPSRKSAAPARGSKAAQSQEDIATAAFQERVGEAIRARRQARSWTQVALAEKASLSSNYVARLERGELGASFYVAARIAKALGVPVGDLLVPLVSAPSLVKPARRN